MASEIVANDAAAAFCALRQVCDEAYALIDASLPTVMAAHELLGNTSEARTLWLAQLALQRAHNLLEVA